MATTALGIMQASDGAGLDPLTHRRIIKGRWANTGVVAGLVVTGRSDLSYQVAAGVAVASRSSSDGYVELYFEGGTAGPVEAGDPSNPRIDAVWVKANDAQQGDTYDGKPDNRVRVGVTQGTPSASPVCPSVPAGCLVLAQMRVPASATSTKSAQMAEDGDLAIPYGASLGLLAEYVNTFEGNGDNKIKNWHVENQVTVNVPTDRIVEIVYTGTMANTPANGWVSWAIAAFQVDGVDVPHSGCEWYAANGVWEDHHASIILKLKRGRHTIAVRNGLSSASEVGVQRPYFRYSDNDGITYKGRILQVWDRGVAQ